MNATDLERRRNSILETIVESYVTTATPVGSKLISRKLGQSLSSATIRHVMGELERGGLLEQPHPSAGRVPTALGYRVYVDAVMCTRRPPAEEARQLAAVLGQDELALEPARERAASILSQMAQQAAFVVAPPVTQGRVRQIELVPLGVRKMLCVLVADEEMIASHVIDIEESITRDEVGSLVRFLNTELTGLPFDHLLGSLERRLLAETDSFYHMVKRSLEILQHVRSTEPDERLFLDGTSYVIAQPEFRRDPRKAHALLKCLESEDALLPSLRQITVGRRVQVRIGPEVQLAGFDECSCVAATFSIGGQAVGSVGVLGPKRMDYRSLRTLVDGMAQSMTEWLHGGASI